jgi:ABC-type polysaccharide/polyol phosphate transport system ATPase subunit
MKVNVGTIGHVDHGKTTLAAALCKLLSAEAGQPEMTKKSWKVLLPGLPPITMGGEACTYQEALRCARLIWPEAEVE